MATKKKQAKKKGAASGKGAAPKKAAAGKKAAARSKSEKVKAAASRPGSAKKSDPEAEIGHILSKASKVLDHPLLRAGRQAHALLGSGSAALHAESRISGAGGATGAAGRAAAKATGGGSGAAFGAAGPSLFVAFCRTQGIPLGDPTTDEDAAWVTAKAHARATGDNVTVIPSK